jgi:predicted DsbA family dithiol-disulfide isomerase
MKVEIYSDVVCPWCSIGKARFEKALAMLPADVRNSITYEWKPYQLDPTAPVTPMPVLDGYARKFGGPEKAREIINHVTRTAAADGITFNMEIGQRANTLDAHRLLWMALQDHGAEVQDTVNEKLFDAYFREGRNVADVHTLVEIAAASGMDRDRVAGDLAGARGRKEVLQELAVAANMGITAVPTFVVDGEWSIPGAQDPETFVRVFERLVAKQAEREAPAAADACDVGDPNC